MESPNKRLKTSPPEFNAQEDFVSFGDVATDDGAFGAENDHVEDEYRSFRESAEATENQRGHRRHNALNDPRNAKDKPKSKHALPGYEPWILVKTKYRRRFVHNTETKESFWFIPKDIFPGVIEFERWEKGQKEKADNAKWAEEQLKQMRNESKAPEVNKAADKEERSRRRRSESLQREDEETMMAELAAQAEHGEEEDAKAAASAVQPLQPQIQGAELESDSEYEVVEVTDSEGEEDDGEPKAQTEVVDEAAAEEAQEPEDGLVEFGEDDIAYQLAAMGEDYGLDPGEYGEEAYEGEWEDGAEGLPLTEEDAANLFKDLLDDYRVSPFTPWDKVIADESDNSILNDDRYTVLPNMRARKDVFEAWVKDKAAQIQQERATMAKRDPKIPYLTFLQHNATPKLYWPEFKRKFKKDVEMNDRKLSDKDREKLYRDHINRLKLPESTHKADLQTLLKSVPLKDLNRDTSLDALPQQLLSHLHFISLPSSVRDRIVESHIKSLPAAPDADDKTDEQRAEENRKREERQRREKAMAERERKVEEERRRTEKDEARARRELRDGERELQMAMAVPRKAAEGPYS
ncbi:hypothetical protein M409DRAFT_16796 [Zasmidium cellare ATCC 36951]|uniref:FF domain-containing protein n=1 Tax=Zasmidium cellare ATCC 36951 TaxID=1080233 RepID=A0A6A6D3X4_ZASCE|nr:uncharacterized protein M409DRAFT_16796 [Zasmidium cellare ATCC 36951]KAF2172839.1 hypothetical protein M409DRAFT_16796 [Zasmidium cellare ATCC 36951]